MKILLAFLALAIAVFPAGARAQTTGALSGRIIDRRTSSPIANVVVHAGSLSAIAETRSDARGYYLFLSLPPDRYTVTFLAPGYETSSISGVPVSAGFSQTLACSLYRRLIEIDGGQGRILARRLVRPNLTVNAYIYSITEIELLERPGTSTFDLRFVPGITPASGVGLKL